MNFIIISVFVSVYLGMILGGIPGTKLDRTGIALLGAIVLLGTSAVKVNSFFEAIDVGTIILLFSLMILSAHFQLAGTYSYVVKKIGDYNLNPNQLLAVVLLTTAMLSAILINDIICLALTPLVIEICNKRQFNPIPFLLGVACASNIGSASTLVGNPQNILVGEFLQLSFSNYFLDSIVPVLLSLVSLWVILSWQYKNRWFIKIQNKKIDVQSFNLNQTIKGGIITLCLLAVFITNFFSRDVAALSAVGFLLVSRSMKSRDILKNVNWQLLILFISLFLVNFALNQTGILHDFQKLILSVGINLYSPEWLFVISAALSNIVSNVPTVMLLLPFAKTPLSGAILALSTTLAGNFFIIGSIANIIVVQQSDKYGVHISWLQHAKTGIPVAVISLVFAGTWLWLFS